MCGGAFNKDRGQPEGFEDCFLDPFLELHANPSCHMIPKDFDALVGIDPAGARLGQGGTVVQWQAGSMAKEVTDRGRTGFVVEADEMTVDGDEGRVCREQFGNRRKWEILRYLTTSFYDFVY